MKKEAIQKKFPYEKPMAISLSGVAQGACVQGDSFTLSGCFQGNNAGTRCELGLDADSRCSAGGDAGTNCGSGSNPYS